MNIHNWNKTMGLYGGLEYKHDFKIEAAYKMKPPLCNSRVLWI